MPIVQSPESALDVPPRRSAILEYLQWVARLLDCPPRFLNVSGMYSSRSWATTPDSIPRSNHRIPLRLRKYGPTLKLQTLIKRLPQPRSNKSTRYPTVRANQQHQTIACRRKRQRPPTPRSTEPSMRPNLPKRRPAKALRKIPRRVAL